MNFSLATGPSVYQMVALIMSEKPLDVIVGQPTTDAMHSMTVQLAEIVAPIKTTAWGDLYGSPALILDNPDYATVTKNTLSLCWHPSPN
jgi:hypothetical protein